MPGQAVGTVVSFASSRGLTLRETGAYAAQWKQMLRDDDCHLLHTPRRTFLVPEHIQTNASYEQLHILFNGVERALNESDSPAVSPCIYPWNLPLKAYMPKIRSCSTAILHPQSDGIRLVGEECRGSGSALRLFSLDIIPRSSFCI